MNSGFCRRLAWSFLLAGMLPAFPVSRAEAQQQFVQQDRGPKFLWRRSATDSPVPVDFNATPVLRQRVSLTRDEATVGQLLEAIGRQAGLKLIYSGNVVPVSRVLHFRADSITVAAALTEILVDAGVDVLFYSRREAGIIRRAMAIVGTISGRVTEKPNGQPIAGAQVTVSGTGLSRYTNDKGQFQITNVPAGEHEVTARRLGFEATSRKAHIGDGETATVDFAMERVATSLTEVVTTATGERSRLEVGNNIGTIKADSMVATSLIRNMSDLLSARVPGVIVSHSSGLVGAPSLVRIRGTSSVSLSNDPIIVLDGIRLQPASAAGGGTAIGSTSAGAPVTAQQRTLQGTTRLDDIDPNTIESIDILRGPSASSLYGTDATAGVIVIKTKKGAVGSYRFNLLADQGNSQVIGGFPAVWADFGHLPNGTPIRTCFLNDASGGVSIVDHTCIPDSLRSYDPYNDPRLTSLGIGTARKLSASLSGGTEQLREFLSLSSSDAVGMAKLPAAEQDRVARMWSESIPSWILHPNTEQNITGNSRTNIQTGHGLDLSLTANGIYRHTLEGAPAGELNGTALPSTGGSLGTGSDPRFFFDTLLYLPAELQRAKLEGTVKRGYVTLGGTYTPLSWLVLHGTFGGDYALTTADGLVRASDCTVILNPTGCPSFHSDIRGETFVTTIDLGAQATWVPREWLSFRTSTGEQLNRTKFYQLSAQNNIISTNLAFGTELLTPGPVATVANAQLYNVSESSDESATAGWYLEETASVRERLFLTAAFRQDVASAFGAFTNDKAPPVYPKFSLSWVVSDETFFPKIPFVSGFRLRTAYGHSGQEARQNAILSSYSPLTVFADGAAAPGIYLSSLIGNPRLRPERTAELEGGFDLSILENERFHLETTVYRKLSNDAIVTLTQPASVGGVATGGNYRQSVNLGKVENRGWELSTTAKILDGRAIAWDLTINASRNINRLVSSSITALPSAGNGGGNFVGYPLQSFFGRKVTGYSDFNGDGILEPGEVQLGIPLKYLGSVNPESELTYTSAIRLWGGVIQVNASVDQVNGQASNGQSPTSPGTGGFLTSTLWDKVSLAQQAAVLQYDLGNNLGLFGTFSTIRFSELSITGTIPSRIATRLLRAREARVTLAGRNLALWTTSTDKDPGNSGTTTIGTGSSSPVGVPEPRSLTFRINLAY